MRSGVAPCVKRSDTKYRDIADGNQLEHRSIPAKLEVRYQVPRYSGWKPKEFSFGISTKLWSDTKYRDIADGNLVINNRNLISNCCLSDTKYRDIADGNRLIKSAAPPRSASQIPSTAI